MKQTATWVSLSICVSLRVLVTFRYSWFNCLLCLPQKRDLLCGTFTACELAEQNRINAFPLFSHGVGNFFIRPTWQTPAYEEMCERLNDFYGTPESKDWVLHMPHKGDICVVKTPTSCGFRCQRGRVTEVRNSVATVRILLVDSGEEWVEEIIFIFFLPFVVLLFFFLLSSWGIFHVCYVELGLCCSDVMFVLFQACITKIEASSHLPNASTIFGLSEDGHPLWVGRCTPPRRRNSFFRRGQSSVLLFTSVFEDFWGTVRPPKSLGSWECLSVSDCLLL